MLLQHMNTVAMIVAEDHHHDHGEGFWDGYMALLHDPSHLAYEITLMIIIDFIILGLIWPLVRKFINERVHKEHHRLDDEHGVIHECGECDHE